MIPALVILLGLVPLLAWAPMAWQEAQPMTAASVQGYDNLTAYVLAVAWCALTILVIARRARVQPAIGTDAPHPAPGTTLPTDRASKVRPAALVLWFAATFLVYSPWFLARYGPYVEDNYFLAALLRMHDGQTPYLDFEFLYGPLMIYPLFLWTKLLGYSLVSYYAFLAVLEATLLVAVLALFQRFLPARRPYAPFLLLVALLFNPLLGPNYDGWRFLLPGAAILLAGAHPGNLRYVTAAGAVAGVLLAYSHDFGVAAIAGILAGLAWLAVGHRRLALVRSMALFGGVAASVWLAISLLSLRGTFPDYLKSTTHMLQAFGNGAAAFRFYWTVNSLALFGLLAIACAQLGGGLLKNRKLDTTRGDRVLLFGFLYTLVALRSGLNRADVWHLVPVFLVLILTYLLPLRFRVFPQARRTERAVWLLIGIVAATRLIGLLPATSYLGSGWVRGFNDVVSGVPTLTAASVAARSKSVLSDRSHADPTVLQLAAYVSDEVNVPRPVFLYSDRWWLGIQIGAPEDDYSIDDFMYSERWRPSRSYLQAHPRAYVVMARDVAERLYGCSRPGTSMHAPVVNSITKSAASWLSTVHFRALEVEAETKYDLWKERAGDLIRAQYGWWIPFGNNVLLSRERPPTSSSTDIGPVAPCSEDSSHAD